MWARNFIVFFFLPTLLFGQLANGSDSDRFRIYLEKYLQTNDTESAAAEDLVSFIHKIEIRKDVKTSDSEFLQVIFNKVHKKFLKNYEDYVPFNELFNSGTYNCLTATALYALLLEYFQYDYGIIETNYHIFLLVESERGRILLETTDPQYGFVDSEKEIEEKIKHYRENRMVEASTKKTYYQFQFDLYNEVDLNELTGLLYYNLAIDAFNQNILGKSVNLLDSAISYYKSERIKEFSEVILLTVLNSDLETSTKQAYVNKVKSLRKHAIL